MKVLYAGSFDPVTRGHLDLIERGSRLAEEMIVAVMINRNKRGWLSVEQRMELLESVTAGIPNVRILSYPGLLMDCVRETGADAVLRGVRSAMDFESEYTMAVINRQLGNVETLMLPARPELVGMSSSAVRELVSFGGAIDRLVPEGTDKKILQMARENAMR